MNDTQPMKNLAPLDPLLALRERRIEPQYLADALKEKIQYLLRKHKDTFDDIARTSEIVSNFIQGKQVWTKSYWSDQWRIAPVTRADPNRVTAINIMQFYCTTQLKMFTASNPDLEPADEFKQKEYRQKVKIAKAVWNYYESRFYTPRFNQQEALHAIISGTYVESVRYDHLKKGATLFRDLYENKSVRISDGSAKCYTCQEEGTFDQFKSGQCPNCGSTEVLINDEPVEQQYQSVTGQEPYQGGDLDLRLIPIQTLRFDVRVPVEQSSWSIERIQIEEEKLRYLLGDLDIGLADNATDDGLRALQNIQEAGNTLSGLGQDYIVGSLNRPAIIDRICLKPEDVCDIKINQDTVTLSGEVIPKDTRLSDICPQEGMTVLAVNDGATIVGVYLGTHHSFEMSSGVYHMRLESGLGRGSEDTVEVQKRFNRNDAQITRYGESAATPARTYIAGSVKRAHVRKIGHPQAVIPVDRAIAQAMGTTGVIQTLEPGTIGEQFFQYTYDILNQYRQLTSHSTDFTNAFPGVDNQTATGARLAKSNAESVFSPALQLKGFVRRGTASNTLRVRVGPQFQGVSQYFSFGAGENKRAVGKNIRTEEIDPEVEFVVVRDSEQPKTMYDRQVDFVNMMNVAGTAGGYSMLKQQDPKLAEALLKAFDISLDDDTYTTLVDVCEERLEQALELQERFKFFQQIAAAQQMPMPDVPPEAALEGLEPSIAVEEPNHMLKAQWFMDYLDCPDGQEMPNEQREIVKMFVRTHAQYEVLQQGMMMQLQAEAQLMAEQPMRDAAAAEEEERFQREQSAELERSQADRQAENDNRAIERDERRAEAAANAQSDAAQQVLQSGLRLYEAENAPAPAA